MKRFGVRLSSSTSRNIRSPHRYELSTKYRLFKHFALGVGIAGVGLDVDVNDDNLQGPVSDSYDGYSVFGTLYFFDSNHTC